ncbi:MAG TPA: flagellar basal body protein [Pirellulales bacterium]|jgi:flagellar basal-body rod protein FlgB|nr:flagellar basal body protein [Pirellulales bacterium]
MLTSLFQGTTIPVLEQVINFAQTRHNVLAGNVANIDTPGYRMRDLSPEMFQARLKAAIQQRDTTPGIISAASPGNVTENPVSRVGDSFDDMLHHDDSNGSLEDQVTAIAKNELQHNTALAIMVSQFQLLQAAISEKA